MSYKLFPKARVPTPFADAFLEEVYDTMMEVGIGVGLRKALFKILEARGLDVTTEQVRQIVGCRDERAVEDWLVRSTKVRSVEELLAEPVGTLHEA